MRRAAAALALALAACGRTDDPSVVACPRDAALPPIRTRVFLRRLDTVVRGDLSRAEIAALRGPGADEGGRLQGLMRADLKLGMTYETGAIHSRRAGRSCAWLEAVTVDLTPAAYEILVPREYPPGSCEYEAVFEHEREHEAAHRRLLDRAKEEITAALASASGLPGPGSPVEQAEGEPAGPRLGELARKVVEPVYARYKEELAADQDSLDLPQRYQAVTERCSNWR